MITFVLMWVLNVVDDSHTNTVQYQYTYQKYEVCEAQRKRIIKDNPNWISTSCHFTQVPVYTPKEAKSK